VPGPTHASSAATSARAHALCGQNHLQHFVGVFEEIFELISGCAQYFLGELRRHFDARDRRVFRHVANLIHLDAGFAGERRFQLFCQ